MKKGITALLVTFLCASLGADEINQLVKELEPERRFDKHQAKFSIEEREFKFQHAHLKEDSAKVKTVKWKVIRDQDRVIALITNGGIHMLNFRPDQPSYPLDEKMPKGRWHIDTMLGVSIPTGSFIPGSTWRTEKNSSEKLDGSGSDRLVFSRTFDGEYEHRKQGKMLRRVTNHFELYCDPVHGYVVDARYEVATDKPPKDFQFANMMAQGTYAMWPGEETSFRSVITPVKRSEDTPRYEGYYNNLQAFNLSDNHRPQIRDGGFGAYLNDKTGWSPCMTLEGSDARFVICNAHADIDFVALWKGAKKIEAAVPMEQLTIRHRLLALPPKLTTHLWDTMDVRFEQAKTVVLKLAEKNDFEDQPMPATTRVRGLINSTGMKLNEDKAHARSGSKSMIIRGTVWPNLPQLALRPTSRYRLTAWMKVVPMTDEERTAHRTKWEKQAARLEKKGKEVKPYEAPPEKGEGWITGKTFEWTPHGKDVTWYESLETKRVPQDGEWHQVSFELTTPAWDPFIDLRFHSRGGTAYMDDFEFVELGKDAPKLAQKSD